MYGSEKVNLDKTKRCAWSVTNWIARVEEAVHRPAQR